MQTIRKSQNNARRKENGNFLPTAKAGGFHCLNNLMNKLKSKNQTRKKRWFLLLSVILLVGIASVVIWSMLQPQEVTVTSVMQGDMEETIQIDGQVVLTKDVTLSSSISGYVRQTSFIEGDVVGLDEILMVIENDSLRLGKKTLEASLQEALSMASLAASDLAYARENLITQERLLENGATSEQSYKAAKNAFESARITQQIASAQVKQMELQLDEAEDAEENQMIVSPMAGTLLALHVQEEDYISPGMPLAWIGDENSKKVEATVLVDDMDELDLLEPVLFRANYLKTEVTGKVTWISPVAQTAFSTLGVEQKRVKIHMELDTVEPLLQPGYAVDCFVRIRYSPDTLLVDRKALFTEEGKSFVFRVRNQVLERVEVTLGLETLAEVEVVAGLSKGDVVVLNPSIDLKTGSRVAIRKEEQ